MLKVFGDSENEVHTIRRGSASFGCLWPGLTPSEGVSFGWVLFVFVLREEGDAILAKGEQVLDNKPFQTSGFFPQTQLVGKG